LNDGDIFEMRQRDMPEQLPMTGAIQFPSFI